MPVRVQSQVSEALGDIFLPNSVEFKNLISFEKLRFNHLHEAILRDTGIPNLITMMQQL